MNKCILCNNIDTLYTLPCGHCIHRGCMLSKLADTLKKNCCPLCGFDMCILDFVDSRDLYSHLIGNLPKCSSSNCHFKVSVGLNTCKKHAEQTILTTNFLFEIFKTVFEFRSLNCNAKRIIFNISCHLVRTNGYMTTSQLINIIRNTTLDNIHKIKSYNDLEKFFLHNDQTHINTSSEITSGQNITTKYTTM